MTERKATAEQLVGAGGAFAGFYFFEEPDDAYAEEAEEREPAEDVDEGPVGGLALELLVDRGLGGGEGVGVAEGAAAGPAEVCPEGVELFWNCWPVMGTELMIWFWWTALRRVRRVWATEMPMEPPTLRMRLKRPLALPICLLSSVP